MTAPDVSPPATTRRRTQALGVSRLDIGLEISPGVPWTYALWQGHPIALALKSGTSGDETFFDDALALLT